MDSLSQFERNHGNGDTTKHVQISFDDLNRVRVLEASEFKQTQEIAEQCQDFVDRTEKFMEKSKNLTTILQQQSDKIETQKMLAIGERNRIETETETRRRKAAELQYLITQKNKELQRHVEYHESLKKVAADQQAMIDRLE